MLHFVRTFLIYAWIRRKNYCLIAEVRNDGKFVLSKTLLKLDGGRMHTPHLGGGLITV